MLILYHLSLQLSVLSPLSGVPMSDLALCVPPDSRGDPVSGGAAAVGASVRAAGRDALHDVIASGRRVPGRQEPVPGRCYLCDDGVFEVSGGERSGRAAVPRARRPVRAGAVLALRLPRRRAAGPQPPPALLVDCFLRPCLMN